MASERRTGKKTLKALFLDQARRGRVKPKSRSADYTALHYYMRTDKEFYEALVATNPAWGINSLESRTLDPTYVG